MQYKKEEVRQRIIETAIKEFEKEGYYKASVLKIATDSKVTIGNLYRYFSSKEDLFEAIVGKAYDEVPKLMMRYYTLNFGTLPSVNIYAESVARAICDSIKQFGRELSLLLFKSGGSKYQSFGQAIKTNIVHMCQFGIFKEQAEQNVLLSEIIANGFLDGVFTVFKRVKDEEERVEQIKKLMLFYFIDAAKRI